MLTDWQARALRMRREGHTKKFIAEQVSRTFRIDIGLVAAFLAAEEAKAESSAPQNRG